MTIATKRGETNYYVKSSQMVTSGKNFGKVLYRLEDKDGNKFLALCKPGQLGRAKLTPVA